MRWIILPDTIVQITLSKTQLKRWPDLKESFMVGHHYAAGTHPQKSNGYSVSGHGTVKEATQKTFQAMVKFCEEAQ